MRKKIFSVETPEDSLGFLLWQTTITWQRLIKKALDGYDISHAQFVILAISLWFENKKQEVSQSLLIRQSKLDKMTVSQAVKKLVAQGYVKQAIHTQDIRAKSVSLTPKGKELAAKLVPIVEEIDAQFFETLKKTDQTSLLKILSQLIKAP